MPDKLVELSTYLNFRQNKTPARQSMGKWKYRKPEPSDIRGLCCECNKNLQRKQSNGKFGTLCSPCEDKKYRPSQARIRKLSFRKFKTNICNHCGFTSEHKIQFDVDHIDGNHKNNDPSNLQTLCANCHRLKTYTNKDGIYK